MGECSLTTLQHILIGSPHSYHISHITYHHLAAHIDWFHSPTHSFNFCAFELQVCFNWSSGRFPIFGLRPSSRPSSQCNWLPWHSRPDHSIQPAHIWRLRARWDGHLLWWVFLLWLWLSPSKKRRTKKVFLLWQATGDQQLGRRPRLWSSFALADRDGRCAGFEKRFASQFWVSTQDFTCFIHSECRGGGEVVHCNANYGHDYPFGPDRLK